MGIVSGVLFVFVISLQVDFKLPQTPVSGIRVNRLDIYGEVSYEQCINYKCSYY